MNSNSESRHWQQSERMPGFAASVQSIDVRRVLQAAERRPARLGFFAAARRMVERWAKVAALGSAKESESNG
jgi:hypothetical protein